MRKQMGLSLFGMLIVCIVIVFVAIGGFKVLPAYIEYFQIKKAVSGIVQSGEARKSTPPEIRAAFERRRAIDDFEAVTGKDLEITKEGNETFIAFSYPKRIPLFANVNIVIDFAGSQP
jgi:Domain of unknown function (DUF4845)